MSEVNKGGNPNWVKGGPSPNPGGKPRKLREIEAMLDDEHRTVDNMREVFTRLKALAMGEFVTKIDKDGNVDIELEADARFMGLYLDRIMGPVKDLEVDLTGVSPEALAELQKVLRQ